MMIDRSKFDVFKAFGWYYEKNNLQSYGKEGIKVICILPDIDIFELLKDF